MMTVSFGRPRVGDLVRIVKSDRYAGMGAIVQNENDGVLTLHMPCNTKILIHRNDVRIMYRSSWK